MDSVVLFVNTTFTLLTKDGTVTLIHELGAQYHGEGDGIYHESPDAEQGAVESNMKFYSVRNKNMVTLSVSEGRRWV